jgi:hypothetical protein
MLKEKSSTKWGRTFIDSELYEKYKQAWLEADPKPSIRVARGISHTIYPQNWEKGETNVYLRQDVHI